MLDTPCDEWQGTINSYGYGVRTTGSRTDGSRRQVYVHREAWEAEHGSIPAGAIVNHRCQNRRCRNVSHLELVSPAGNIRRDHAGTVLTMDQADAIRSA